MIDHPSLISPSDHADLTLTEYAHATGQSPHTIRTKIRKGEIPARLVKGPRGMEYRIPTVISASDQGDHSDQASLRSDYAQGDLRLIALLDRVTAENSQLQAERAELFGRLGFYQARLQELERRVLELEAPKDQAPAEMTPNPSEGQNGQDSSVQQAQGRPWWAFWRQT